MGVKNFVRLSCDCDGCKESLDVEISFEELRDVTGSDKGWGSLQIGNSAIVTLCPPHKERLVGVVVASGFPIPDPAPLVPFGLIPSPRRPK